MSHPRLRRREFLKTMAAAAAAVPLGTTARGGGALFGEGVPASAPAYDAKGLPTAVLGKTGVAVPRIGIGLGSRFCAVEDEDPVLSGPGGHVEARGSLETVPRDEAPGADLPARQRGAALVDETAPHEHRGRQPDLDFLAVGDEG